eukprot:6208477-Pleurochrysis_carterae.AAC.1
MSLLFMSEMVHRFNVQSVEVGWGVLHIAGKLKANSVNCRRKVGCFRGVNTSARTSVYTDTEKCAAHNRRQPKFDVPCDACLCEAISDSEAPSRHSHAGRNVEQLMTQAI